MNLPVVNDEDRPIADSITEQTGLALESSLPLFLIVYYEHEARKLVFLQLLQQTLRTAGLTSQTFDPVQRTEHGAGRLYQLLAETAGNTSLALINGLPRSNTPDDGASAFLNYLNLHRDRITHNKLRMALFLHSSEAQRFMAQAGDLWDFRHHTYWLEGSPVGDNRSIWQAMDYDLKTAHCTEADKQAVFDHLKAVRALLDETVQPDDKATILLDLSRWLRRRNLSRLAIKAAMEALEILPDSSTALRADTEHELGFNLNNEGNLSDALAHYRNALEISRKIGDRNGEGSTLNNISQIYDTWGRHKEALETLNQSLAICREIGDRRGEGTTLNNISQIYRSWGRHEEALETLHQSLAIYREIGDRSGEGVCCWNLAIAYKQQGNLQTALKFASQTLQIEEETGHPDTEKTRAFVAELESELSRQ